ncbi:gamma-aminobutyric acid transporter [Mycena albidolilacea]|uniref:Gamma-aminobutyric acid transporter n=1 Tax=Mycena albidolilacea TaxID=1033008 RepID=A0AAD7EQE3_9AGAR|nr:gamma-aminobutyric acid transporter [Mycena albidolilacea]
MPEPSKRDFKTPADHEDAVLADQDELQLGSPSVTLILSAPRELRRDADLHIFQKKLGYKQQLHRSWNLIESFAASFCALCSKFHRRCQVVDPPFVFRASLTFCRSALFLGLLAGGPAAICGSIYIWAAESAGSKDGRFFGFVVAWWSCTAWMTFAAGNCQTTANYIVSQLAVWEVDFPGGISNDSVKWRALIWAISEALLVLSVAINYLPPRMYSAIFRFSVAFIMLDFFLCVIWLPIGVSKTYGFRSAKDVFTSTCEFFVADAYHHPTCASDNGTGAPPGWNWILCFLFTAGTLTGFDASGHIAEETKMRGKGILTSALATGVLGFLASILFLFCIPDLDTLFALEAPQPFVLVYALALGKGGSIFMTIVAVIGLMLNTSVTIVVASRLVYAVARDGVLPLSSWISKVTADGQPQTAVTVIFVFAAALLCTILPSQVAFTSLVSAGAVPTIAAYGLIALLRLTFTPNDFQSSHFRLGRLAKPFYACAVLFNALDFQVMISPFSFPVDGQTFNFACVIFGAVTIFGIASWYFTPEDKWLRRELVLQALHASEEIKEE